MEILKEELIGKAKNLFMEYLTKKRTGIKFLDIGMGIAIFAREEKKLFLRIFLKENIEDSLLEGFLNLIRSEIAKDERFSNKVMPSPDKAKKAYTKVSDFWKISLAGLEAFKRYINLTNADKPVSGLREDNLLLKPVTQMAIAHVAYMAWVKGLAWKDVIERLNKIDWSFDNALWFNILIIPSAKKKMITGKESIRGAGMVISYLVMGNVMTKDEVADVKQIIQNARNDEYAELPDMV